MPRFPVVYCLAAAVLLGFCATAAAVEDDRVWIAMTVRDGRAEGGVEYYGLVNPNVLREVLEGTREKGFLKLEKVFWLNDKGEPEGLVSQPSGYTGTAHFRIANIDRIVQVKKEFIEGLKRTAEQERRREEASRELPERPIEKPSEKDKE